MMMADKTMASQALLFGDDHTVPLEPLSSVASMRKKTRELFRPLTSIVVLAWAVRVVSVFNMMNALLRYQPKFIFWLGKWVPFEISEGHRIRLFLMSVLLLVLASALQKGKRLAWQITIAGLLLAPILHLGRGAVWPQAMVNLALIGFLFAHRRYFVVASDPKSIRSALVVCPLLAVGLLTFGTIRLHALHKHISGSHTWWACLQTSCELVIVHSSKTQVAITPHSKDLFTVLRMGGTSIALLGLIMILRPVLSRRIALKSDRDKARKIIDLWGHDPLDAYALLRDKSYFFSADGKSVIPYVHSGNMAIALADPIGPETHCAGTISEFAAYCRRLDWEPVFYEITDKLTSIYEEAGFAVFKIGEEARLRGEDFSLHGGDYQNLRTACNSARKKGIQFRWYDALDGVDEALEHCLAGISQEWLKSKKTVEMTFDMGSYSLAEIRRDGAAVAIDAEGHAIAFATWRPYAKGSGRSLDLMRSLPSKRNVMDFVLVESVLHFRSRGINDVSLGTAPLANVRKEGTRLLAEEKAVQFLFENLNRIYGYKSLFEFKRKYRPHWQGRYVAYRRGVQLPRVGLALVHVHAPGRIWKFLMR
jgi:phosphatidylglycerol lysyltransferase